MPCPAEMYQSPLGSISAVFQIDFSLVCVPESSPREINGASAAAIALNASAALGHALDAGRVARRADDHEVVVHHVLAARAEAVVHELVLARPCVHQHHVGVAVLAQLERLAGADCHIVGIDPKLLLKVRQDHVQQPRVRRAGGRGDDQLVWVAGRYRCRRLFGCSGRCGCRWLRRAPPPAPAPAGRPPASTPTAVRVRLRYSAFCAA